MPTQNNAEDHSGMKLLAAQRALKLIEPGMTVGLGSGSTATLWIRLLGEQVRDHGLNIRAIASSEDSKRLGRSFGIHFVTFEKCLSLDVTVDGADEIAPGLALIKGGGRKTPARENCRQRIEAVRDNCGRIQTSREAWSVSLACRSDSDGCSTRQRLPSKARVYTKHSRESGWDPLYHRRRKSNS